jgi:hypothetical protein
MHVFRDIHDLQDLQLGWPSRAIARLKDLTELFPPVRWFRLCRIPDDPRRTRRKDRRRPVFLTEFFIAIVVVTAIKTIRAKSIQAQDQLVCRSGCGQILMLLSGKSDGPHVLAGNALLHKMGAVTPNRKLVVSPGKLHLVKNQNRARRQ